MNQGIWIDLESGFSEIRYEISTSKEIYEWISHYEHYQSIGRANYHHTLAVL